MLDAIFISSIFFIFYSYIGYPLSLILLGWINRKEVMKGELITDVTIIITAYNEEKRIRQKIENTLAIEYPQERLQIVIVSDGSTDATNDIVNGYGNSKIQLLALKNRTGKENAQKEALKFVHGEIVVFTDIATMIEPSGIRKIVSNFTDPTIGCVSSEDRFLGRGGAPSGEGFYVRYEMMLRRLESRVNSLVGLSGSFFAARKTVVQDFQGDMQSDFRTLLNSVKLGLRGVSDPEVTGSYLDVSDPDREFDRKIRTILRGLTVYFRHMEFLNVFKYGVFSYQYFCHKLLRWLVPFLLVSAFVANLFLSKASNTYFVLLTVQLVFYGIGILGWLSKKYRSINIIKIPFYFLTVNMSILIAWWRYLRRERIVMWTPSER